MKILIAITLFNKSLNCNDWLKTLQLLNRNHNINKIRLLITDNSNDHCLNKHIQNDAFIYVKSFNNGGTRATVLNSIKFCDILGYDGTLFLDDDSQINNLITLIDEIKTNEDKVVVPKVFDQNSNLVSPCGISTYGTITPTDSNFTTAILSGSYIPRSYLNKILKIPKYFWLDYLDHYLFTKYFNDFIVSKAILNHNLSVSNVKQVRLSRLINICKSELFFYLAYKKPIPIIIFIPRLFYRISKYLAYKLMP